MNSYSFCGENDENKSEAHVMARQNLVCELKARRGLGMKINEHERFPFEETKIFHVLNFCITKLIHRSKCSSPITRPGHMLGPLSSF